MSAPARARAMYRGYWHGGKQSARVTRLHVIRDSPPSPQRRWTAKPAEQTWCGQSAGPHRNSVPVVIDPVPDRPPAGLSWCPSCIGHLAEWYGLLDEIAGEIVSYDPGLADLPGERWRDAQREVRRAGLLGRRR